MAVVAAAFVIWEEQNDPRPLSTTERTVTVADPNSRVGEARREVSQETDRTQRAPGADALLVGLVGIGALLLLAGFFRERLRGVILPGGAGVQLGPSLGVQADVLHQVLEQLPPEERADPRTVETAYLDAISVVSARAAQRQAEVEREARRARIGPSTDEIEQAVKNALRHTD
ncbi:MAG TPA: hypothetical protein VF529_07945 [Solirubrobacteraceae bacterium]